MSGHTRTLGDVLRARYRNWARWIKGFVLRNPLEREAFRWFRDSGDQTLRLQYELDVNSIVFDLGGYEGDWAAAIHERYGCVIHVFEPVRGFLEVIQARFRHDSGIFTYGYGLHSGNEVATIRLADNASSVFGSGEASARDAGTEEIRLRDVAEVLQELGVTSIDLMKVNIEGGEYDLIERLIDTGLIRNIEHIQVQFHSFVPDAKRRRDQIRQRLRETHYCSYDYEFIWESWARTK